MLICSFCDGVGAIANGAGISEECPDCKGKGKLPDQRRPEEIAVNQLLFGTFLMICDQCGTYAWFKGEQQTLDHMIRELRESDAMLCPRCHGVNEIKDEWRVMLK